MFSVREVAKRLNVSPSCVYGLISAGKLKCHRIGLARGTIRVSEEALGEFLTKTQITEQLVLNRNAESRTAGRFRHLDGDRLSAAWRQQGVCADRPSGSSARSSE
jgi:excisionase family DNA binding protein